MDIRTQKKQEVVVPSPGSELVYEQAVKNCTTYDELYKVIESLGDVVVELKDYEAHAVTSRVYTPQEIRQIIDDVRDGKISIYAVPKRYAEKVSSLLATDRGNRSVKITF